jgi:GNAT superfamily N-acetyltransferase
VPTAKIVLESPVLESFRVAQVRGMFDVPAAASVRHEWDVSLPVEEKPWQVGLVVGPSGSGKTVIGRRLFAGALFHEGYAWPEQAALVDAFPAHLGGAAITQALSSVGFSSPPHWLKRFAHLSNGQRFRCELARVLLEDADCVVFDEFTSVVDRDAAKTSSAAVARALRSRGKPKLVALSCHYDVVDWLQPDWVFDTASMTFAWRSLRRRPPIRLDVREAHHRAWSLFSGHHYLSRTLNRAARCFVALWDGNPVAFTSCLNSLGARRKGRREHRTVVLPDYQGVGIGNALSEWLGAYLAGQGLRFVSTTSHPAMIRHRQRSPLWRTLSKGHQSAQKKKGRATTSAARLTARFEYAGPPWERGRDWPLSPAANG